MVVEGVGGSGKKRKKSNMPHVPTWGIVLMAMVGFGIICAGVIIALVAGSGDCSKKCGPDVFTPPKQQQPHPVAERPPAVSPSEKTDTLWKPRLAVMLVGYKRSFVSCLPSFMNHFVESVVGAGYVVDVYVYGDEINGAPLQTGTNRDVTFFHVPSTAGIDDEEVQQNPEKHPQMVKTSQCFQFADKLSRISNFSYEFFVKSRPDLLFEPDPMCGGEDPGSWSHHSISSRVRIHPDEQPNKYYWPVEAGECVRPFHVIDDQFLVVPGHLASFVFGNRKGRSGVDGDIPDDIAGWPEGQLTLHISSFNIQLTPIPLKARILRT